MWEYNSIADAKTKVDEFCDENFLTIKERNVLLEALLSLRAPSKENLITFLEREKIKADDTYDKLLDNLKKE